MLKKVLLITGIYSYLIKRANMAYTCCICKWQSILEPRRLFHRFPSDANLRKKWCKATGISEAAIGKKTSVCALHFPKSFYVKNPNGTKTLKDGSLPTLRLTRKPDATKKTVSKPTKKPIAKRREFKCDACGGIFQSLGALKTHIRYRHLFKNTLDSTEMKSVNILRTYGRHQVKNEPPKANEVPKSAAGAVTKKEVGIECPKCEKTFSVYFSAYRHIQKFHCVDSKGNEVAPDSPYLIKPVSIEQCVYCKEKVRSTELHNCPSDVSSGSTTTDQYLCLGCKQAFDGLVLFECHLKGVHSNEYESFFFQDKAEFIPWKTQLESQTKTKFIMLNQTKSKQIYHCTYQPVVNSDDGNITQLCPSSIVVQEFSKGIQVTFFKEHCGHSCEKYTVTDTYRSKCVKLYMREIEEDNVLLPEDDKDLYVQFKRLMNNIVLDAAKLNITMLKILKGKALEMTAILNNYDEDADPSTVPLDKSMTDDQITNILTGMFQGAKTERKRKTELIPRDSKRVKWDSKLVENDENSNKTTKQIKDDKNDIEDDTNNIEDDTNNIEDDENDSENDKNDKVTSPLPKKDTEPSSFNDSYKNFVDQTFLSPNSLKTKNKRKEVVKTRMGQFKPNSPTTKKESPPIKKETRSTPIEKKGILSANKKDSVQKKKPVTDDNIWKVKPDTEYEVLERDDDCNILVLKI